MMMDNIYKTEQKPTMRTTDWWDRKKGMCNDFDGPSKMMQVYEFTRRIFFAKVFTFGKVCVVEMMTTYKALAAVQSARVCVRLMMNDDRSECMQLSWYVCGILIGSSCR